MHRKPPFDVIFQELGPKKGQLVVRPKFNLQPQKALERRQLNKASQSARSIGLHDKQLERFRAAVARLQPGGASFWGVLGVKPSHLPRPAERFRHKIRIFAFVDPPTLKHQLSQRKTDVFLSLFRFAGILKVEQQIGTRVDGKRTPFFTVGFLKFNCNLLQ